MKKDLHPSDYRPVVFQDTNSGFKFLARSTAASDETIKWEDGNEYPLVKVHISSDSHPFYTGEEKIVDVEGRVDRFKARRQAAQAHRHSQASKPKKSRQVTSKPKAETAKVGAKAPAPKRTPDNKK